MTPLNFDLYSRAEIQGFMNVITERARRSKQQARKSSRKRRR